MYGVLRTPSALHDDFLYRLARQRKRGDRFNNIRIGDNILSPRDPNGEKGGHRNAVLGPLQSHAEGPTVRKQLRDRSLHI